MWLALSKYAANLRRLNVLEYKRLNGNQQRRSHLIKKRGSSDIVIRVISVIPEKEASTPKKRSNQRKGYDHATTQDVATGHHFFTAGQRPAVITNTLTALFTPYW
jgi:hypothetical protein